MKTNNHQSPKSVSGWRSLFRRRSSETPTIVKDTDSDPSQPPVSPLVRIQEYLAEHGLSQKVQARCETDGGFVLEDADGLVHAKNFGAAVAVIERIWLYGR